MKAYSLFTVKAVDEESRIIEGIATTPTPDRVGDIVEPLGAKFKTPMPLLLFHKHDAPVGQVTFAKATKEGIPVRVEIPKVTEAGAVRDRVDEAWHSVKYKLIGAFSIGFRALEGGVELLKSGALLFKEWEWLELSLVSIPANAEATIQAFKSLDTNEIHRLLDTQPVDDEEREKIIKHITEVATYGKNNGDALDKSLPVVSGKHTVANLSKMRKPEMKTVAEQIKDFRDARAAKAAEMEEIMNKSAESGETLDQEESEKYDTLEQEVAAIDKHLKRLDSLEKAQASKAKDVTSDANFKAKQDMEVNGVDDFAKVRVNTVKKPPGVAFAQYAKCLAIANQTHQNPVQIARSLYSDDARIAVLFEKAAVPAANTGNDAWAGALVGDETSVFADFVAFLRPQTILGRFGADGIPSLRMVPFRTPLIGQTSGGDGYWVGEGKAKPLTKFDFNRKTLEELKVANIAVATKELLRDSSPSADLLIRDSLVAALRERLDRDFIDPAKAALAGISPASILNGVMGIASSGTDAAAVRQDIRVLFAAFIAANNAPTAGVWIMPSTTALALSLMQNPLGQAEFPGIGMSGGTLFGLPVIVSEYVPSDSSGAIVALVNASDIYLADEGGISVDMSTQASLEMVDNPTGDSTTPTATQLVNLWQTNSVGFLAERTINWMRRRDSAVAYLTDVNWGAAGS